MIALEPNFKIMENVMHKATKPLVRDFSEIELLQNSVKGPYKFASKALERTNKILVEELKYKKSTSKIYLNNKLVHNPDKEETNYSFWLYSIDGYTGFCRGVDDFALMAVLIDSSGNPLVSLINFPSMQINCYSFEGGGSWFNKTYNVEQKSRRIRCSETKDLKQSFIKLHNKCMEIAKAEEFTEITNSALCLDTSITFSQVILQVASGKADIGFLKASWPVLKAADLFIRQAGGSLYRLDQTEEIGKNIEQYNLFSDQETDSSDKTEISKAILTNNLLNKQIFKDNS
jgi:3'-phosphoadenosine 5'-phosphosulfate (PAPS) 3'-phosphatase